MMEGITTFASMFFQERFFKIKLKGKIFLYWLKNSPHCSTSENKSYKDWNFLENCFPSEYRKLLKPKMMKELFHQNKDKINNYILF